MTVSERVSERIRRHKIIAILRGVGADKLLFTADALMEGGIRLIECAFDHTGPDDLKRGAEMIALLKRHVLSDAEVGCGTALSRPDVEAAVEAGASFVISPNADREVISRALELGAVSIPGAMTPGEIVAAFNAGANFVKLFPAGFLGPDYLRTVMAPLRHIPILAVGGVTPGNISAFAKAGAIGFGVGSQLVSGRDVESGDWAAITRRAKEFVASLGQ